MGRSATKNAKKTGKLPGILHCTESGHPVNRFVIVIMIVFFISYIW